MKLFKTKKGISPLVATVILIAFAVALGAVIMNIGTNIGVGKISLTEQKECQNARIQLLQLNNVPQITFGGSASEGFIEFTLDNVGMKKVERVRISVLSEKDTYVIDLSEGIEAATQIKRRVPYDYNRYGTAQQVAWTPMVYRNNELITCASGATKYMT